MAYPRPFRTSALSLLAAALLGGCCANDVCQPDDPLADAVKLKFAPAFTAADLDTINILRYPRNFTANTRPETVTLVRTATNARDSVVLNNSAPFARVGSTTLGAYRYVVQYLAHPNGVARGVATTALVIDSVRIRGIYKGSKCCTNYTNTDKTAYVQGAAINLKKTPNAFLTVPK